MAEFEIFVDSLDTKYFKFAELAFVRAACQAHEYSLVINTSYIHFLLKITETICKDEINFFLYKSKSKSYRLCVYTREDDVKVFFLHILQQQQQQ